MFAKIPPGGGGGRNPCQLIDYDVLMHKINNDRRYLIQFLDARYNNLWLFPLPK